MSRHSKSRNIALIFAFAMAIGGGLALLTPTAKPIVATIPVAVQPVVTTPLVQSAAQPADPILVAKAAVKRLPDGSAKMPEAPAFVERAAGVYEASGPRYTALLSAGEGLRYLPKTEHGKNSELRVRLSSVMHGSVAVFDRATDASADSEIAVARVGGGLSYWRTPSFEEIYEPRGNGIEQSFVLDTKPTGDGDIAFTFDINIKDLVAIPARANRNGGFSFADKSGEIAVRYGQIIVRDAEGKSVVIEPTFDAVASAARFSIPQTWIDGAKFPVVVDPLVGTDFAVSNSLTNPVGVEQPTVCAGNNNFLVAWNDFSAGVSFPQLVGAIVTQAGSVSSAFAITSNVGRPLPWRLQRIECAFDGSNWLVAWSDDRTSGAGIRGAIIGNSGTLLGGTDFLISGTTGNVFEDPLVGYNGTNFVVAWTDTPLNAQGGSQVFFTFVNSSGAVGQSVAVQSNFTAVNQSLEYLATQRPNGDTLILYQELNETPTLHRSIRIQTNGTVKDIGGTALFKEDQVASDGTTGYGRPIGAVYNNNEWQILSTYAQLESSKVFLHRLSTTGVVTPPNGVFAEMGLGPTGFTQLDAYAPAFPGASEWLFLRNERASTARRTTC